MNDKYLHTFRRQPDPNLTDKLYQRLVAIPPAEAAPQPEPAPSRRMRLAWAFIVLVLTLFVLAMVPGVRARFEDIVKQIGGLTVLITEDYPGTDNPRIVPDDILTLEEARARLDFEFRMPTYIPDGLVLQEDEIRASNIRTRITLNWRDENTPGRGFHIVVGKADPDVQWVVGPNSVTEVMINDINATLVQGGWNGDTHEWEDNGFRDLRWQIDGIEYTLSTGNEEWGGLSDEELIKIAESIAPVEEEEGRKASPES